MVVCLALGERSYYDEDQVSQAQNQARAEGDPGPYPGVAGGLQRAGPIPGRHFSVHLGRVDNRDDPERQATEDRREDRLDQVVGHIRLRRLGRVLGLRLGLRRRGTSTRGVSILRSSFLQFAQ